MRPFHTSRNLAFQAFSTAFFSALTFSALSFSVICLTLTGCSAEPPTSSPPDSADLLELTVLHTNDTHARYDEFDRSGSTCSQAERDALSCFGGLARRATAIEAIRRERPNVLLLDGGDQFQGTLFYSRFKGLAAQRAMNHLRYDAMVVGNHEFDDGPATLGNFAAGINFPLLGTNVGLDKEPALNNRIQRSTVLEIGGRQIGLVGYITEETPDLSSPGPTLQFNSIEEELTIEIKKLRGEGIQTIIALSHAGFERDQRVAQSVDGLDIIVSGHTNTFLSNSAPTAEDAPENYEGDLSEGPYPMVVDGPGGDPVLLVSAMAWGKYLGRLDVMIDGNGIVRTWLGDPLLLDAQILPDPETLELLAPMRQEVSAFSGVIVGESRLDLVGREVVCRAEECNLGNLIADALLEAHREQGAEIALQNGGGIRSSLGQGQISVGQILEVLPFGNAASTFGLYGSDLLEVLEHGVSRAENLNNDGTGRFLQVAGLRYAWDGGRPVGERILRAETPGAKEGDWQPIEAERIYQVVMNAFNRNGGDGFSLLAERAIEPYDQGELLSDIVRQYLETHSPVSPGLDGRISRGQ